MALATRRICLSFSSYQLGKHVAARSPGVSLLRPFSTTASPDTTRVGWIGTGVMGKSMCKHILSAGYPLTVYSRTAAKTQELVDLGATRVESPQQVGAQVDIVFSMVGFPSDVREVLMEQDTGVLHTLRKGGIVIDMTTSDPTLAREVDSVAKDMDCHALDCPVTGGDVGAKAGTLSIMVGGDPVIVEHVQPLLATMGEVFYLGKAGAGQSCKAANQVTIATSMLGMCEGLLYAHQAGLDLDEYIRAIRNGGAGSKSLDLYSARILKDDYEPGFYIKHFVKDLGIALGECERMGIRLPGLSLAHELYKSLETHGDGDLGTQALITELTRMNNVDF